ncbi:MAG: DNA translocase FtsK [Helicobacter sp.]|nr:DNA translocase FtsK [Helicobacter sp.]MDY4426154.1 DNA translocase FtsK [Helicobacter sp.]
MMSLERFKNFEKNIFFQEEEDNDPIKLIKKTQDENLELQETNPFAFLKERQEPQESPAPNPKEDQSPQESLKESPKPIKAYPKKLYSATPFSAYYEKNPADATRNCLVPNDTETSQNQTTITNEDPIAEATPQNKPASIQQQLEDEDMRAIQMAIQEELQKAQDYLSVQQESSPNFVEDEIVQQETQETQETQEIIKEKLEEKKDIVLNSDYLTITNQQTTFEESPLQESPITSISQDLQEASLLQNINFPVYGYGNTFSQTPQETNPNFAQQTLPQQKPQENTPTPITPQSQQETLEILQNAIREKRDLTLQFKEEIAPTPTKIPLESNQNQPNQSIPNAQESITQVAPQTPQSQTNTTQVKILEENQNLLNEIETSTESKPIQTDFILPKLEFLQTPQEERIEIDEDEIDKKINDLLNKLRMFKIEGDIVRTYSGPIVTTFEFRPSPNVKVSRIQTLQDDLAMALRAKTIRIQAPVPGKDVVGIEIPNSQIQTIYLREILENDIFQNATSPLTLALGKDIVGNPFVTDLKKLPHLLIAGTTGSGKSVGINAMILSLLYKNSPDTLRLLMIDPKMLEFSIYNDIPHLLTPVITQPKKAIIALDNAVKEMERRYTLMSEARIKNIESYNKKAEIEGFEPFPYIVIVIDELADLMMSGGKEAELSIARLAQMARASGIHLIVATQRPSVDVVTGTIKANLPSRISYKVGQKIDSKVILDSFGAESLLGRGDMLFTPPGGGIVRLHAPWSTEEEIEKIVEFIKLQRPVQYNENFMPNEDETLGLNYEGETDELYEEAKRIMLANNKTSISYIQRRLGIGYNKAANIVEQMISRGFLSQPNSKGVREIIGE